MGHGWGFDDILQVPPSALCSLVNVACRKPPELFDQPGGIVFFWMLAFSNIFVVLVLISVVGGFITRLRDPAGMVARTLTDPRAVELASLQREALGKPSLTVLLPCYLPNEQPILDETIEHLMNKLVYAYPFKLIVCYNTPRPMDYEATLCAHYDGKVYEDSGRSVHVLKVEGSTSKAENLNAALELVDTEHVVLYDADHHPDPDSLLIATAHMAASGVSCVQGSTYLRVVSNLRPHQRLLSAYINAEFFATHFVYFPAMQFLTSLGVFGGSNALWRTAHLKSYQFRHDVQTEDIELSTRALLGGQVKISFCPDCRSGELPPATFCDLYKQRLRWALGWDQVTLQHGSSIWSARLGCLEKAGMYYILPLRWGLLFSATLNALIAPLVASAYASTVGGELGSPITMCQFFSFSAFVAVSAVVFLNAVMHEPWHRWPAVMLFQVTGIVYIGWQLMLVVISLSKICRGADAGWVVTSRAAASQTGVGVDGRSSGVDSSILSVATNGTPRKIIGMPLPPHSPIEAAFAGDVRRDDGREPPGTAAAHADGAPEAAPARGWPCGPTSVAKEMV